jgi:soluble P-type ATPase
VIEINIPGYRHFRLEHLVLDYNGTLAVDGMLLNGVKSTLTLLSKQLKIHVLTADTFGKVQTGMDKIPCEVSVLPVENQEIGKLTYVRKLGEMNTAAVGNGRNDRLMLQESALGIAVILNEGAAMQTLLCADVVCTDIVAALQLLIHPLRLTATLRS